MTRAGRRRQASPRQHRDQGGRVVPIEGEPIEGGTVLIADGKITAVAGPDFALPAGAAAG